MLKNKFNASKRHDERRRKGDYKLKQNKSNQPEFVENKNLNQNGKQTRVTIVITIKFWLFFKVNQN